MSAVAMERLPWKQARHGAIFLPPWTALARLMASLDLSFGKVTTLDAA
jgi:hypothetical protein